MSILYKWKQGFQWRKFQDKIGEPPWDYYFLQNLQEKEYPMYLARLFYLNTGEELPLRHWVIDKKKLKTFNQKLQWLKLYGVTHLMRDCTDKVKVRDYVKEKIGEEYLKPMLQIIPNDTSVIANHNSILGGEAIQRNLRKGETRVNEGIAYDSDSAVCDLPERQQIQRQEEVKQKTRNENSGIKPKFQAVDCHGTQNVVVPRNDGALVFKDNDSENNAVSAYFNQIDFDKLPNSFVIKTNHGCKWQYIIKNKNEFLSNKRLFDMVKRNITGWLEQDYSFWGGFEMQYHSIKPKIIIEEFLGNSKETAQEIEVYCFNGIPKIIKKVHNDIPDKLTMYDENFNYIDFKFLEKEFLVKEKADDYINQTFDLSIRLSEKFSFVRCDYLIFQNKIYFNEMTFTPNSGLIKFDKKWNKKLGSWLNLEGDKNGF